MGRLAALAFRLAGWRTEGTLPPSGRFVLIAAPHTSNWDAIILLVAARVFRLDLAWFVKASWFKFPMGPIMRRLGGVPIDRSARHGVVEQAIERFKQTQRLALAVPPEGTRGLAPYWKTGFYHIARGAKVPIVLGFIDYGRKVAGLGPAFTPTGDLERDFEVFRAFYDKVQAKYPEKKGAIAPPPTG
ncbi:MAG: Acyltransferase family protein [bacterium]|nr:Acyltransferase family protein [bacterium]